MSASTQRRIGSAFTQRSILVSVCVALVAVALFAGVSKHLLYQQMERQVSDEANLCALAMVPGPNGDLLASIDRLTSRFPSVAAVATLDVAGNVRTILPDLGAYRVAATRVVKAGAGAIDTRMVRPDGRGTLWGIAVPLAGVDAPAARRVLFLLAHDWGRSEWMWAIALFATLIVAAQLVAAGIMKGWVDRRLVGPLRHLAGDCTETRRAARASAAGKSAEWFEMASVAHCVRELRRNLAESNARHRHVTHAAELRIQDHRDGLDRKLRRAEDQAITDPLTGLRNRKFLEREFGVLVSRHRKEHLELSVVMIDVDNFKYHNDTNGHSAGDEVLAFIGELLRGAIRPSDHAIRYGGDEFVLLLPGTPADHAAKVVERIVKLFGQYAASITNAGPLAISAGVASLARSGADTTAALLQRADQALYTAKRAGKNGVAVEGRPAPVRA